jgi:hypothetical protein
VCDFQRLRLHDLIAQTVTEFQLKDFYQHVKSFGFMAGCQAQVIKAQGQINIKAVSHSGHDLEVYLVRLLFCLFAEDAIIFEKRSFRITSKPEPRKMVVTWCTI